MRDEGPINFSYIVDFVRSTLPERSGILKELEISAKEDYAPILLPESAAFLECLCSLKKPDRVLEIGTAIGYSAILIHLASGENSHITTIDRNGKMVSRAKENIKKAGLDGKIDVVFADASEVLPELKGSYDLIFLDAAKGQYPEFLPYLINRLTPCGALICDNVLFRGKPADEGLVERRNRTIYNRLNQFFDKLFSDERLTSSLIPIGDGMSLSIRKEEKSDA